MQRTGLVASVVRWLRAGYPEGVPERDYLPLFALLASQLTHDELRAVARELETSADPQSAGAIRAAIELVTHAPASEADIANVRAHLAAVGDWPAVAEQP
jgi:hypothetical protein